MPNSVPLKNIRFIHQDAVAVLPTGEIRAYALATRYKPLLILNTDEFSAEKFDKLLKSGFYRNFFCDPARIEQLRITAASHEKTEKDKAAAFKDEFIQKHGGKRVAKQLFAAYESTNDMETKRQYLEQFYDEQVSKLKIENIISKGQAVVKSWHDRHNFATKLDAFGESKKGGVLYRPFKALARKVSGAVKAIAIPPNQNKNKIEECIEAEIKKLPTYIGRNLESIGVQFAIADTLTYFSKSEITSGTSNYVNGTITLLTTTNLDTLEEESIHYLDSHLGFSAKRKWIEAVEADSTSKVQELINAFTNMRGKQSIYEECHYSKSSRPAEFLVELHKLNSVLQMPNSKDKIRFLNENFPHTYPLYEEFIANLKSLSAHTGQIRTNAVAATETPKVTQKNWGKSLGDRTGRSID